MFSDSLLHSYIPIPQLDIICPIGDLRSTIVDNIANKNLPLGRFFLIVAMSVRPSVSIYLVPSQCDFFRGLSLALRSHDQIPASHWWTHPPPHPTPSAPGLSQSFSGVFPGFAQGFPRVFPGFSRGFPGVFRGFPGVFLGFSWVFPGVFPGLSRGFLGFSWSFPRCFPVFFLLLFIFLFFRRIM